MATLSLNLFLDKKQNTVIFAECDRVFVETLLSFLTLPLGTIVRLLNKQTAVGCLDKLYASVEQLEAQYLQTSACRDTLLHPRSEAGEACEDLLNTVDDLNPRRFYGCENWECLTKTSRTFSMAAGTPCGCQQPMDECFTHSKPPPTGDLDGEPGVFLKGLTGFIISDGLQVMPTSTGAIISLLQKHGINSIQNTTMKTVQVDKSRKKMLEILRRSFVSSTPLTDVFLGKKGLLDSPHPKAEEDEKPINMDVIEEESNNEAAEAGGIVVKLLQSKCSNRIVCAEVGDDLVNQLFGFLTFPLGLIVKLLRKKCSSSVGSLWNLYNSVESLSRSGHMKAESKALLVDPKLAPFHGCSKQIISDVEETPPPKNFVISCRSCFLTRTRKCPHAGVNVDLSLVNPKLPSSGMDKGGGFVKSSATFIVTNEMAVKPFSSSAVFSLLKDTNYLINDLVEKEVTIAEPEVLRLLKASVASRACLIDALSHKIRGIKEEA